MADRIYSYKNLRVYQSAFQAAMEIYQLANSFPRAEKYNLVDQINRSSRSVCSNLAEAWRKRRYKAAFIAKLSDAESEACETQVWLQFAYECNFIDKDVSITLDRQYERIMGQIVLIIKNADKWLIHSKD
jgi:four helix bundle protein